MAFETMTITIYMPRPLPKKAWPKLRKFLPAGWKARVNYLGQRYADRYGVAYNHQHWHMQDRIVLYRQNKWDNTEGIDHIPDLSWLTEFKLKLLLVSAS